MPFRCISLRRLCSMCLWRGGLAKKDSPPCHHRRPPPPSIYEHFVDDFSRVVTCFFDLFVMIYCIFQSSDDVYVHKWYEYNYNLFLFFSWFICWLGLVCPLSKRYHTSRDKIRLIQSQRSMPFEYFWVILPMLSYFIFHNWFKLFDMTRSVDNL